MNRALKYVQGFISLFYPKICVACNTSLLGNEGILCTTCRLSLPETNFHHFSDNPVEKIFWGRMRVEYATSLLFFDKGSKYRHMLHELKYKGKREVGVFLGKLMGARLLETEMKTIDFIIPIPLHPLKLKKRGFNQSEEIAKGVAMAMKKPIVSNSLKRIRHSSSQTYKGRFDRWKNTEGIFDVENAELLMNKHILLIDDIVTTGATLEAAGSSILKIEGTRLSIATIAFTS